MGEKTTVTIEPMLKEDIEQVLTIERSCFSQPWSRNLFLSEFRSFRISTLLVAVLHDGNRRVIAGYVVYWNVEDEMHILNLAVAPKYQRLGIARNLVLSGIRRAMRKGARRAFLEVRVSNEGARKLYASLGFTGSSLRRNYYDAPIEDAVVMTLEQGAFESLANSEKTVP